MRKALSLCAAGAIALLAFSCTREDPVSIFESNYKAIDLGLSVKWASCNVGANSPEGYGDYFAWGETESKATYDWSTYKWSNASDTTFTKYCPTEKHGFWHNYAPGTNEPDNKMGLDQDDDVARIRWGSSWRMPTAVEWKELKDSCEWTWSTQNGVRGILITRKENVKKEEEKKYKDVSLFLPAAGDKFGNELYFHDEGISYWSSSLTDSPFYAWNTGGFSNSNSSAYDSYLRCYGRTVRPVYCPERQ